MSKLLEKSIIEIRPDLKGLVKEEIDLKKRFDPELTGGKRITFSKESGINSQDSLDQSLAPLGGIVVRPAVASGPRYKDCGFLIQWNGTHYSVLLKAMATENARKWCAPDNLGLGGKIYTPTTIAQFRQDIITGLDKQCGKNKNLFDAVFSLIVQVETGAPVSNYLLAMKKKDQNPIVCDFGEVLSAYRDLWSGIAKKTIEFPVKSNQPVVDYWRDGNIISVKGPGGGGKLNLEIYKSMLSGRSNVAKFLSAHAEHNREDYFKYAAKICPWINIIANLVGGTAVSDLENFIRKPGSYNQFYNTLKGEPFPGVGVPKKRWEPDWRRRWEQEQSLNPIWFSIITVMTRWGETDSKMIEEMSHIMKPLFTTEKFVNVELDGVNITFNEVFFSDITSWSTHFHSNAGGAWANWPSIKVSETK